MPKITHVKKAQQRYETRPVLDDSGQPKRTPVMVGDTQKVSRHGLVFMTVTEPDLSKPQPDYMCDHCGEAIKVGTAYKHISPKSGPYGGQKRTRHETCPDWQVWDYSSSLSARIALIQHTANNAVGDIDSEDAATQVIEDAKEAINELVEEKRDAAQNIEDGFQHETEQSQTLTQQADDLEAWAEEGDQIEVGDMPDEDVEEFIDCGVCDGEGKVDLGSGEKECERCDGEGTVENDEYDPDAFDAWRDNLVSEIETWIGNSPV
jgi:hypothetical protein